MDERNELVCGIDFGTTNSRVGVWQDNVAHIIFGGRLDKMPSYVAFTNTHRMYGNDAKEQAAGNLTNTIFHAKRLIGSRWNDPSVQSDLELWPFKVIAGDGDRPTIDVSYLGESVAFSAVEILSMILQKIRVQVEDIHRKIMSKVVLTVPANFNNSQRQAIKDAAFIAGMHEVRIINETTAAAITYHDTFKDSLTSGLKETALIFHLGGGTFDVSLVEFEYHSLTVRATAGDTHLGGIDFDHNMVEYLVEEFREKHGHDIREDLRAISKLRTACEKAKIRLSYEVETTIDIDSLYGNVRFTTWITRPKFEDLNRDLFRKCMKIVRECLSDANTKKSVVSSVVMAGESTKIPKLSELLNEFFTHPDFGILRNGDEGAVFGATVLAGRIWGVPDADIPMPKICDVIPLTIGWNIESQMNLSSFIIPWNTHFPMRQELVVDSRFDNQWSSLLIYESKPSRNSNRARTEDMNNLLGRFFITNTSSESDGTHAMRVILEIDNNGILLVYAEDLILKNQIQIISETESIGIEELRQMCNDAVYYREVDIQHNRRIGARTDFEWYIYQLRSIINDQHNNNFQDIQNNIDLALEWLRENEYADSSQYIEKKNMLQEIADVFGVEVPSGTI